MQHVNNGQATRHVQPTDSPIACTLNLLNQRWTLHIVRRLLAGKMRFNEMVRTLGVNACTLRNRLRELERRGIIHRQVVRAMPPNVEYSLTEKGMALHDVMVAIEDWGSRWQCEEQPARGVRSTVARGTAPCDECA